MEKVPIINEFNLRNNPLSNKFIQLYVHEKPYFRFIRIEDASSHSDILYNTLVNEFGIIPETLKGICSIKSKEYNLVGAGLFRIEDNKVILYGNTEEYYLKPNKIHLQAIEKSSSLEFLIENKLI